MLDKGIVLRAITASGILSDLLSRRPEIKGNSQAVLNRRYLAKDRTGKIVEDNEGMFRRVARNVAQAEANYGASEAEVAATEDEFCLMMRRLEFLPNSPTLMNAGRELQQLSACFVLPVEDSLESIFTKVKQTALIHKSGGGTGFSFSRLRPEGDVVGSTGGIASGPVSFIRAFDTATDVVKQGGCFTGDTLVCTVEGNIPIRNLVNRRTLVYSWSHAEQRVVLRPTSGSWMTYANKEVWELVTEKGLRIRATADHPFMLRSGEYRKLSELTPGTPLMPLRRYPKADEIVIRPRLLQGKRVQANNAMTLHRFVYEETHGMIPVGLVVHHINGDHFDNRPENLMLLTQSEHAAHHGNEAAKGGNHVFQVTGFSHFGSSNGMHRSRFWSERSAEELAEYRAKLGRPGDSNPMRRNACAREKVSAYASTLEAKNTKLRGRIIKLCWRVLEAGYHLSDWQQAVSKLTLPNHQRIRAETVLRLFNSWDALDTELKLANDRVVSVSKSGEEAVYNLEVEDTHNYAVTDGVGPASRGVFVSNTRRGANMAILDVTHPDILKFIESKKDGKNLQNFNISVAITEGWMEKMRHGEDYDLINPRTGKAVGELNALKVFNLICQLAWETGDPGLWFKDRVNRAHPNKHLGQIESTNPCGESALLPFESCNLGSIVLSRHIKVHHDGCLEIDWGRLKNTCRVATRFLDDVIDMNQYPLPAIREASLRTRRIGVGVMGFADLCVMLGVRYDSAEGVQLAEQVMKFLRLAVHEASADLAVERGSYPAWEGSDYQVMVGRSMRNTEPTVIAPTGTISIIAGVSSGIEPLFALSYVRNVMDKTKLVETYPLFEAVAKEAGFYSPELMERVAQTGSLLTENVPDWAKELFVVSHDITPEWHVKVQAAFQKHTDNSVSKTINFPHDAAVKDIAEAYRLAYETGCKGITVYRDGSKDEQVLSLGAKPTKGEVAAITPRERPALVKGVTERLNTGHGNMYVTVNFDDDHKAFEVFGTLGKAGGCDSAQLEAISRLVSLALRCGIEPNAIVEQLKGITCCPAWDNGTLVRSGPDAVAVALERHAGAVKAQVEAIEGKPVVFLTGRKCPDCNGVLMYQEGCARCQSCGWNKCD